MYTPKVFRQSDIDAMVELMRRNALATFISNTSDNGVLNAEHLPLLVDLEAGSNLVLRGHLAKANPVCKQLDMNQNVLVVFQGVDAYVSPNWYPSKKRDSKVVPTWNYSAVHVKGRVELIYDSEWILALLSDLTNTQEAEQAKPWKVSDAPSKFVDTLTKAVVGIKIDVDELIGKQKLSQNQSLENRQGVKAGLAGVAHPMSDLIEL